MNEIETKWTKDISKVLVGRTIKKVRYLTQEEAEQMGWFSRSLAFLLDSGVWVYASADDEGNDGGALFTSDESMPVIPVLQNY